MPPPALPPRAVIELPSSHQGFLSLGHSTEAIIKMDFTAVIYTAIKFS